MDILNNLKNERTSSITKLKIRKKSDENSLKQKFSFKMKKEKENSIKKKLLGKLKASTNNLDRRKPKVSALDKENYFMKKIFQMKKEINKNDFSINSEKREINNNINDNMIKKIGSNLKHSLIQLKYESAFEIETIKSLKSKPNKTRQINSLFNSPTNSPKSKPLLKNKTIDNIFNTIDKNLDKSDDLSNGSLLIDKNNSNLELLNNEEKNNNIKNENQIKTAFTNKSIKLGRSNTIGTKHLLNEKYRKLIVRGILYDSFDDEEEEFEDQINKDFYIMPNSIFIIILDTLIFLDILYRITYNPYYIASSTKFVFSNMRCFYEVYHFSMELIYFVDFLVQFVRAYHDFDENLVTNTKKIILHYLGTWFFIDLITILPLFTIIKLYNEKEKYHKGYDYVCNYGCQSENMIYLLCFIKLIKIFKIFGRNQNQFISFIWSFLSNTSFIDNWGTIVFQVSLAIFCLHITACFHIIIGRNAYPNWITEHNLSESNFSEIYIASIYFLIATMTSVGYGDITGNSIKERIFQIFLLIIGIMAYSWLVSSVSHYVIEINKDNIYFESKVNILDDIKLAHPEMDIELYSKIYLYLKQLKLINRKKDKNLLLDSLPFNIKNLLLYEINKPLIEGLNFFKNFHNSVFILSAVTKLIPILTNKGDIIIEQNEIINNMIFVKQGRLGVEIAVDINNKYDIDNYVNGTFILGEERNKNRNKDIQLAEQYRRRNSFSLMSTLNYTMDDSFMLSGGRKLDLSYKKPVSFRKRLLKFMEKKFSSSIKETNDINEKRIKYVKLFYIRKGEHFGEIFMFLNKPSSFTLRVKSPKAELLLLKKIDAIEISSKYPNIWKRLNKKSFKNLINLKELVSREMIKFCGKNGIKYNLSYKLDNIKRANSTFDKKKLEKNKSKKDNLNKKFERFKRSCFGGISATKKNNEKKIIESDCKKKKNENNNNGSNIKYKDSKYLVNQNNNSSILNLSSSEKDDNNNNNNLNSFKEDEINDELYIGEEFIQNINNDINLNVKNNHINEKMFLNLFKKDDIYNNFETNRKDKNLNKLLNSSRRERNSKIFYHKSNKHILKNQNNFNIHYNINNSFNINNLPTNSIFCSNKLIISNAISFNINKIYDNLNDISKGNYKKDINFQKKIKSLIQDKYNLFNGNKKNNTTIHKHNQLTKKLTKKETEFHSLVTTKNTFFKRCSKFFSLIKENEIKNEQIRKPKRKSMDSLKDIKANKDDKEKKSEKDESSAMLNKITQNIIDGDKNLNNPQVFYNELFANIIQKKNTDLPTSIIKKKIKSRSSLKIKGNLDKKISKKNSILSYIPKHLLK